MAANAPQFSLDRSRYDQSTFLGRFKQLSEQCDPRCLVPSVFFGMSLQQAVDIINSYKAGQADAGLSNEQLWTAKKIYQSAVHPDTGEVVPAPFRMCGFAVFNTPVIVGMLIPNQSLARTVMWHSVNQTHNACVNYANRNASQPTPISKLLEGYAGALTSSVGLAVGLQEGVKRSSLKPSVKATLSRFVAFPAVASAAILNITLMRRNELTTGIAVTDDTGKVLGSSQAAAKKALSETALTRVVLPAPLLILPPLMMMGLERTSLFTRWPRARLPVQAAICTAAFVVGLPLAIALFPQQGSMPAADIEPELRGKTQSAVVYYNKGL